MRKLTLFAAGVAAVAGLAAPAAAQYYPYPQPQPNYGYGYPNQGNGVGDLIGRLLGNRYGSYAVNERSLINQCAAAASAEASRRYRPAYSQQGYPPYGNAYGYNQAYPGGARVTAITNVERRSSNRIRVSGLIDSGAYGYQGYNQPYGYNQAYARGDLSFRCTADAYGRITDLRVRRR